MVLNRGQRADDGRACLQDDPVITHYSKSRANCISLPNAVHAKHKTGAGNWL